MEALLHSIGVESRYYCFVMGEETQSSPLLLNQNLGPGLISGGGDMWSFWSLDSGSHTTKASTFMAADDRTVLGWSNWAAFGVP